jgi:hypothetical protein
MDWASIYIPVTLLGSLALLLASAPVAAQPTVEKSAGKIDDRGCFQFEATLRVEQPIDRLYNALSRPEALWIHVGDVRPDVFVGFPWSKDVIMFNVNNSFSVDNPFTKIVELSFAIGASGPAPRSWREYRFDPKMHRISKEQIGSTRLSGEFRADYSLASTDHLRLPSGTLALSAFPAINKEYLRTKSQVGLSLKKK